MTKKKSLSPEFYKNAVKQLRKYADGFDAAHGYDLRDYKDWSPQRKAFIHKYAIEASQLTARPNYVFRARNKEHLKLAQEIAQHEPGFKRFKVAFIPYNPPANKPDAKPDLHFSKGKVIVKAANYEKKFIPFNKKKIITDADNEIARVMMLAGKAKVFQIQAGKFLIPNAYQGFTSLSTAVKQLMAKYDGKRELPSTSGNRNDKPSDHHHSKWLNGVIAYQYGKGDSVKNRDKVLFTAEQQRRKLEKLRAAYRRRDHIAITGNSAELQAPKRKKK